MSVALLLLRFGLRSVFDAGAKEVVAWIDERFADSARAMPQAVAAANQKTWQVIGLAVAEDTLGSRLRDVVRDGDARAARERIRNALEAAPNDLKLGPAVLRDRAAAELAALRARADAPAAAELDAAAAGLQAYADASGVAGEATRAATAVAGELVADAPHLASVLRLDFGGTPLFEALFRHFLRALVAKDDDLSRRITHDQLHALAGVLDARTAGILDQIDVLFDALDAQFAGVNQKLDDIRSKLDKMLDDRDVATGVRDPLKVSVTNEKELAQLRHWRDELRKLPPDLVPSADWARLGDALAAARMFAEAQEAHQAAARTAADRAGRAEAEFKAYRDACEREAYDDALEALVRAAGLDPDRFTPFPLNRYDPVAILGAGGFGTVVRCRQRLAKGREVAVKTLHAADLGRGVDDVFAEAHALSELADPGIVRILHWEFADPAESRPYLVMEYFPGVSLAAHLRRHGPLPVGDFVAVARRVAGAMAAAHAAGILHRDLKPGNVLVARGPGGGWDVRVIDFGLAVRFAAVQASVSTSIPHRTRRDQSFAGTLEYASPEQKGLIKGEVGPQSDVYGFGKTMLEALLGTTEPTTRAWRSVPDGSRDALRELLEGCVEKNPADRHPGFEPVADVLAAVGRGAGHRPPVGAPPVEPVGAARGAAGPAPQPGPVRTPDSVRQKVRGPVESRPPRRGVWPTQNDYKDALQYPDIVFRDPDLRASQAERSLIGPKARSGAFASVYKLTRGPTAVALKLFNYPNEDRAGRYLAASDHLKSLGPKKPVSIVGFEYHPEGIRVGRGWYPTLTMEWVKGKSLGAWVREAMEGKKPDTDAVRKMADAWVQLVLDIQAAKISHGDLQHDNVMVVGNTPVLVDYDGMCVPALADPKKPLDQLEFGKPAYQHPGRPADKLGLHLDHFAAWVILVALRATAADPALYTRFVVHTDNENLLFSPPDMADPLRSRLWPELLRSPDADVRGWAGMLRAALDQTFARIPPFDPGAPKFRRLGRVGREGGREEEGRREDDERRLREQEAEERMRRDGAERERAAAEVERRRQEQIDRERAERMERWTRSGQPREWVSMHLDGWDQDQWAALVRELESSPYWPLKAREMRAYLHDLLTELRAERARQADEDRRRAEDAYVAGVLAKSPPATPEGAGRAGTLARAVFRLDNGGLTAADLLALKADRRGAAVLARKGDKVWDFLKDAALADPTLRSAFRDVIADPDRLTEYRREACEALVRGDFDAWDARWGLVHECADPEQLRQQAEKAQKSLDKHLPTLPPAARDRLRGACLQGKAWPDHHLLAATGPDELNALLAPSVPPEWQGYACFAVMGPDDKNWLLDGTRPFRAVMRERVREHLLAAPAPVLAGYVKHAKTYVSSDPVFVYDLLRPYRPECRTFFNRLVDVGADRIEAGDWAKMLGDNDLDLYGLKSKNWEGVLLQNDNLAKLLGGFGADPAATPIWDGYLSLLSAELLDGDEFEAKVYRQLDRARQTLGATGISLKSVASADGVRKLRAADTLLQVRADPAAADSLAAGELADAFRVFGTDPVEGLRKMYLAGGLAGLDLNVDTSGLAGFVSAFRSCYPITHEYPTARTALDKWLSLSESCPDGTRAAFQVYLMWKFVPANWYGDLLALFRERFHPHAELWLSELRAVPTRKPGEARKPSGGGE